MSGRLVAGTTHRNRDAANAGAHGTRAVAVVSHRGPDLLFGGPDHIAGTTAISNSAQRTLLRVYEQSSGVQAFGGWSDAQGAFRIERVSLNLKFFIVAFDPLTGEQAVIFDRI